MLWLWAQLVERASQKMLKHFVVFSTLVILLEVSSVSNADGMPGHMLMEQIRGRLLGGRSPGSGFLGSLGHGTHASFGGGGAGSAVGRLGGAGIFGGSFPLGGGGLGDSVPGPGGGLFGGPINEHGTSGPLIDINGDGGHQPGSGNSRIRPSIRPSGGLRFGEQSSENSEEGLLDLSRKRKGERREHDHVEHLRYSRQGSQEGSVALHGGKGREPDFGIRPAVMAHEGGDHGSGPRKSRRRHGNRHSHGHGSNEENDCRNEEKDDHTSRKEGKVSISTFAALSLARQCLNLLHDMLALLTSNRSA
ncbi:uncharacterized PE-PGRS family protein PE_PGRS36-like isoform X5 [Dermacentor silvarum]|uniref:uncharacterized PE-PGRS family protein PE_PGRS36-like isoform X5 n=1 Tax=Dermacentor silvarum TaxID=543639 RepID=UPI002101BF74|nr:uncharacterized PE-PGRS family protein PE_PGRS36-like isoform X5 [Dermacentor silvarum]